MRWAGPRDVRRVSAFVIVPLVLVVADVASTRTSFKFLLLPPFAALTYVVFVNPAGVALNARRVIVAPTVTGILAWVLANTLGYNILSIVLASSGTMLIMWLLDAPSIVPPMALALLTLLLHDQVRGQFGYVISVFLFTLGVYAIFRLWLLLPFERWSRPAPDQTAN